MVVHLATVMYRVAPGVALAALIMYVSLHLAGWVGSAILQWQGLDPAAASSPVSGVPLAIIVGILLRNTLPLPRAIWPGIRFCVKSALRIGIVLVGIKLSLLDIVRLGAWGIPIVFTAIAAGLILVNWVNRLFGLPPRLGTLIAAGTSICGVTAILSVAPTVKAEEKEVAYAIANITLFGLVGMFAYPYVAPIWLQTSEQVGLFLGIAIHDTAQVVGAALTYREVYGDDVAFQAATVTKLTRNLFLAAVVPVLAFMHTRGERRGRQLARRGWGRWGQWVPGFVIGFIVMAVIRTIGDATAASGGAAFGLWAPELWGHWVSLVGDQWGSMYLLGTAMAAVGLNTSFSVFKGVGLKPFLVGLLAALLVGTVGFLMVLALGGNVRL